MVPPISSDSLKVFEQAAKSLEPINKMAALTAFLKLEQNPEQLKLASTLSSELAAISPEYARTINELWAKSRFSEHYKPVLQKGEQALKGLSKLFNTIQPATYSEKHKEVQRLREGRK